MKEENPYSPPQADISTNEPVIEEFIGINDVKGIGGWLIVPVIGLFLTSIQMVFIFPTIFLPIFTTEVWAELTTPGTAGYHALFGPIIIFELVMNLAFFTSSIIGLVLLFKKKRLFPRFMIGFYMAHFILISIDHVLSNMLPGSGSSIFEIAGSFVRLAVWGSYMVMSKRVKATFVN